MKQTILGILILAGVSFTSCNGSGSNTNTTGTDSTKVDSTSVDSTKILIDTLKVDSTVKVEKEGKAAVNKK